MLSIADKTVAMISTTSNANIRNDRLQAFLAIMISKPLYDRKDDIIFLIPAILTDEIQDIITSTSSTLEQAQELSDNIEALAEDVSKSGTKFPFLSSTLVTYGLQAHYHSGPMHNNLESLKR